MPNCGRLTGSDRRRAEHLPARQAWLLRFIAPTSRFARYGAPTVFSSPPVECFSTERSAVERPAGYLPGGSVVAGAGSSASEADGRTFFVLVAIFVRLS